MGRLHYPLVPLMLVALCASMAQAEEHMKAIFRHTKHLGIAALLSSLVALAACGTDSEDASGVSAKPTVALIMKSLANEFFVTMAAAAERHQDERQDTYELIVNGIKNESDLAQQVALVDQMIALGVDAIVIAPADSKALVPALARARSSGIQVVNIDNRLDRDVLAEFDLAIPFIGPDNRKGAKAAALVALQRDRVGPRHDRRRLGSHGP